MFEQQIFLKFFGLLGGASLLLYGLDLMSQNLSKMAGNSLRLILEKATQTPILGLLIGAFVTGLVNSSSAVTSILVSFVQSNLMTFEKSIAVILGANIGSTVTGQIMAFDITKWAMAIIFLSFTARACAKDSNTKYLSMITMGLGILFLGLEYMSSSMVSFRESKFFIDLMIQCEDVWFGIVIGAVFTAIIHSSGAFTGIIIGLAMQNLITLEIAVPLILGSNIGTCVTAWIASIGSGTSAKRVAMAHILYNLIGVLMFAFWVPDFIKLTKFFTPDSSDVPRLIANAQTYFNIFSAIIFLPFLKQLEWLTKMCVKQGKEEDRTIYLLPNVKEFSFNPELLLLSSTKAIREYKNQIKEILWLARSSFISRNHKISRKIIYLNELQEKNRFQILDFLNKVGKLKLPYLQVERIIHQVTLTNEIHNLAMKIQLSRDILNKNIEEIKYQSYDKHFTLAVKYFSKACNSILNDSLDDAYRVINYLDKSKKVTEEFRKKTIENLKLDSDSHEAEKITLWLIEFIDSINSCSYKISTMSIEKYNRHGI
jgi:phosphate:Na+ symporter